MAPYSRNTGGVKKKKESPLCQKSLSIKGKRDNEQDRVGKLPKSCEL